MTIHANVEFFGVAQDARQTLWDAILQSAARGPDSDPCCDMPDFVFAVRHIEPKNFQEIFMSDNASTRTTTPLRGKTVANA